jgi:hypothetical protein
LRNCRFGDADPHGCALNSNCGLAPMYRAIPAVPVATWQGSYVGIEGGGAWGRAIVHSDLTGVDQTPRFDLKGGFIG